MRTKEGISHIRTPHEHTAWLEATIQFVNADEESVDSFVAECLELGAVGGLEAAEATDRDGDDLDPCESCGTCVNVRAYFPDSLDIQDLVDLLEKKTRAMRGTVGSPDARARVLRCRKIRQEEWATRWKEGFPPEQVSGRFWVVPPWQSASLPDDAIPMILEPGQAFGTGKHATTRHCLALMEDIARGDGGFSRSFLDAGCGSGILSIAARRLGAGRVVGLDIDPDALRAARRNLELNGLFKEILLVNGTPACCRMRFDLIAANLDATTLLQHRQALLACVARGGRAILSGMLAEEESQVVEAFKESGFSPAAAKTDHEEGWITVLLERP